MNYYSKTTAMKKHNIGKLTAARCTLVMMASGMKVTGIRVKDVAEAVGAPKTRWNTVSLMRWVEEKILLVS